MAFIESKEIDLPPLTEGLIQDILFKNYERNRDYMLIANIYLFAPFWESDFLIIGRKKMKATEIEIKISRSDFFNDKKKKEKHEILQQGSYNECILWKEINGKKEVLETKVWSRRPHKFYYCVPEGLVSVDEVPSYAGLIYIEKKFNSYTMRTVKNAPKLHDEVLDVARDLMIKFYFYWKDAEESLKYWKNKGKE